MPPLFDPFNPEHYLHPHERLAKLRNDCPISEPAPWLVFVARYKDVRMALRNTSTFSNAGGVLFPEDTNDPPTILQLDAPEHLRLRHLQTHMEGDMLAAIEPTIRKVTRACIEAFAPLGRADLMSELAFPLPTLLAMHFIHVPEEHQSQFSYWAEKIQGQLPYQYKYHQEWSQLTLYLRELIAHRRSEVPVESDMLTRLIQSKKNGATLTDDGIRMALFQLVSGGMNVSMLIGSLIFELLQRHELWERVYKERMLITTSIDEALRHDAPSPWAMRLCVQETMIGGVKIDPGKRVVLSLTSANADEEIWSNPEVFSLDRGRSGHAHMAFGYGPHFCLGAALSRLEMAIVLEELLDHFPRLRLAPDFHYEGMKAAMLHGPQKLDVFW